VEFGTQQISEAAATFRRYAQAFQALDPQAVAKCFNEPAVLISPDNVTALPTAAAVKQAYAQVMADLPAKGYARTEFSPLAERQLSADVVTLSGTGRWQTATGEELSRFGLTYTLRRTNEGWRIVVAIIHDP
jgi:ketosteroid isomerase-like protein